MGGDTLMTHLAVTFRSMSASAMRHEPKQNRDYLPDKQRLSEPRYPVADSQKANGISRHVRCMYSR